ncbi:hypothetical protein D3C73_1420870 [compost metagenome]
MKAMSSGDSPDIAMTESAASANSSPSQTFNRPTRSIVAFSGSNRASISSLTRTGYGEFLNETSSTSTFVPGSPAILTKAASIPSTDVPDISPTA